jgi:uncharacterized protein (TIGR03437 family)
MSLLQLLRCLGSICLLCPLLFAAAEDRIVDRVDLSRRTVIRGNHHPQAAPGNDRGPADATSELSYVTVLLRPAAALEQFLREQQDPASPNYRRWLKPEQFADRFGLTAADTAKLVEWLQSQGLRVHDVARGRHWITFSGSVDKVGRALGTQFRRYHVNGEDHIANADEPSAPAAFADVIAGFSGLNDFAPRPMHVLVDSSPRPQTNGAGGHAVVPDDFATIYNVKPLYDSGIDGTGIGIAVIGRTALNLNDIRTFRSRYGLPPNDPKLVLVGPDPGNIGGSNVLEADLDLEWSGAVARNATISYVYARSVDTALQYAIDQNVAPVVTYSYGSCETASSTGLRFIAQQANAQGITFLVASGDAGAATCDYFTALTPQAAKGSTVSYPANVPEVTAVGGTQFNDGAGSYWAPFNDAKGASALSYIPEAVWNRVASDNGLVSSGGGPSSFFAKPYWQLGPGVPDDKARDVPDVSLSAGGVSAPYLIVSGGSLYAVGGTSASAPSFAGIVALLNQYLLKQGASAQPGLGNINPAMYRLAQASPEAFHDVMDGDNKVPCVQGSPACIDGQLGYSAGPGYDLATGLGSIDAYNFVTKWTIGTASTTTLTANPASGDLTTPVNLTAIVTAAGAIQPTGSVSFLASENVFGTVPLVASPNGMTANLSVKAGLLAAGTGPVMAMYSGDGVYNSSTGSASVTLNVPASGSMVVPFINPNPIPQAGASWPYVITLTEKAGVATKITGFTVNGADNSGNIAAFNNGNISAHASVSAPLAGSQASIPTVPFDRTFVFTGQDADGTRWTQQITATFVGPLAPSLVPAISLTSTPSTIQQNPAADPSCQWSQEITLDEHSGYLVQLSRLVIGGVDVTGQIQPLFGTVRLAPYGVLRAPLCWDKSTIVPSSKTYTITGVAENGTTVTASATVSFQPPPALPAPLSASPQALTLSAADNQHDASAAIDLGFGGGAAAWKVSVTPSNTTTAWLKVSPISGTGAGQIAVRAATSGLSNGAYSAIVAIEAPGAVPDHFTVPVVLVVGDSTAKVGGIQNAASFQQAFAPGMLMSVYVEGLTGATALAPGLPLPLRLAGISATINGVAAPISGIFPAAGLMNIQVPYEAGGGPSVLAINNGGRISSYPFTLAFSAPGLFGVWDPSGLPVTTVHPGQVVIAYITGEGDVTPFLATGATPVSGTPVTRLPKARQPLTVTVGDVPATVAFNGIPTGFVGVTQINFTIPAVLPGPQPVVVTVGNAKSQAVTLTVTAQ